MRKIKMPYHQMRGKCPFCGHDQFRVGYRMGTSQEFKRGQRETLVSAKTRTIPKRGRCIISKETIITFSHTTRIITCKKCNIDGSNVYLMLENKLREVNDGVFSSVNIGRRKHFERLLDKYGLLPL